MITVPMSNARRLSCAACRRLYAWRLSFYCRFDICFAEAQFHVSSIRRLGETSHSSPVRGNTRQVRCLSLFQPTVDGTLVNCVTRGKMRLAEACDAPNAMVNDMDAGHEKGCGSSIPQAKKGNLPRLVSTSSRRLLVVLCEDIRNL